MALDELKIMNVPIDTNRHLHLEPIDTDKHKFIMFKGPDGKNYATSEGLAEATEAHERATLYLIAHDANRGRVEIPYGSGDVQVCVGHKIEHDTDANGMMSRREVPVYKTVSF